MCEAIDELIEDGRIEGRAVGKAESIIDLLKALGDVSEELQEMIFSQRDTEKLRQWLFIAAKADTVAEFERKLEIAC